jgi:hypothetical protein
LSFIFNSSDDDFAKTYYQMNTVKLYLLLKKFYIEKYGFVLCDQQIFMHAVFHTLNLMLLLENFVKIAHCFNKIILTETQKLSVSK